MKRASLPHPTEQLRVNANLDRAMMYGAKMSPGNHDISRTKPKMYIVDPTNPGGAFNNGVEHRLHIRGRPADDAKHLCRCRLMLQGFTQFCITLLDFFEQTDV